MRAGLASGAVAALLALVPAWPATAARPDPALQRSVATLASLLSDGEASLDTTAAGAIRAGDRVAVVFSLQGPGGGNGLWQFLAFFDAPRTAQDAVPPHYRLLGYRRVGMRGERLFAASSAAFAAGDVVLRGARFAKGDAMCCPSRPITRRFRLRGDAVEELPAR